MTSARVRPVFAVLLLASLFLVCQGQAVSPQDAQQQSDEKLRKQIGERAFQNLMRSRGLNPKPMLSPDEVALIDAFLKSDNEQAAALLAKGVKFKIEDKDGRSPMGLAVGFKDREMIQLLLDKGADINETRDMGTPLWWAANQGDVPMIEWLLERGADVNKKVQMTPAAIAAIQPHLEVVKLLISKGAEHDIYTASLLGDTAILKKLIAADPKAATSLARVGIGGAVTPIQLATIGNHEQAVGLLLDAGADIDLRGREDRSPLEMVTSIPVLKAYIAKRDLLNSDMLKAACWFYFKNDRRELTEYLISLGVLPTNVGQLVVELDFVKDRPLLDLLANRGVIKTLGPSTLSSAIQHFVLVSAGDPTGFTDEVDVYEPVRDPAKAKWLIEQGISVKPIPTDQYGPVLNTAVSAGNVELVKLFIDMGLNVNPHRRKVQIGQEVVVEPTGIDPLVKEAVTSNNLEILKILVENGSDVDPVMRDGDPWTPLKLAVLSGKREIVEYLISKGADAKSRFSDGQTLSQFAAEKNHTELAEWLKSKE